MNNVKNKNADYLLAVECFKKNDFNKTVKLCKKIKSSKNKNGEVNYLFAMALTQLKNYSEACIEIENAIENNKNKIEYYIYKGNLRREMKDYEEALSAFQKALLINKKDIEALYWTSVTMYQMGQKKSALNIINTALLVEKNNKLLILKAKCLEDIDDFNGALEEYKKILEISSKEIKAQLGMGDLLRRMFRYDEALECATKAMEIDAENINCYLLKSVIYKDIQKIEDSINVLDLGLKVKPNSEQANFNKSILLLQSGNFKEGWDLYEWRWRVNEWTSVPLKTSKPIWNGEKCETLYIWPEQGIGDEVMFSSIFDDVRSDVNKLIVKIDIRLKEVYERSFKNIKFIDSKQVLNEDEYDYHLPMGSLPKFYRSEIKDFEKQPEKYLKTNVDIDAEIAVKLNKYKIMKKIGISWKSKNPLSGMKRSAGLEDIIKYINDEQAIFINLQYGDVSEEISMARKKGINIITYDKIDNMKNIDGLLSLINFCDEVVSIDNSTVHFAGAIGKKTEVLMHESADFRWEMKGETTKWYKSLKLKRNIIL